MDIFFWNHWSTSWKDTWWNCKKKNIKKTWRNFTRDTLEEILKVLLITKSRGIFWIPNFLNDSWAFLFQPLEKIMMKSYFNLWINFWRTPSRSTREKNFVKNSWGSCWEKCLKKRDWSRKVMITSSHGQKATEGFWRISGGIFRWGPSGSYK